MYVFNTCTIHVLVPYDKKMFVSSNLSYPLWHIVLLKVPHTISFKTLNIYIILHWVCVRKLIQDKWTDLLCIWWQDASHTEITCELELFGGAVLLFLPTSEEPVASPKIILWHPTLFVSTKLLTRIRMPKFCNPPPPPRHTHNPDVSQ